MEDKLGKLEQLTDQALQQIESIKSDMEDEKQNLNKSISWLATTLPEVRCRLAFAYISCRARQKRIPQDFIQEQTTPYRLPKDCQQLLFDSPFMTAQTSKL